VFFRCRSFAAGAVLLPVGAYCIGQAIRKNWTYLGLASVPVLFGIQKISEGFVWLGLQHDNPAWTHAGGLVFLFFALALWPFWFPLQSARACSQSHHSGGERACARLVLGLVSADRSRPRHADDRDRSSLDPVRIPQFADLRVHLEDSVAGPLLRHHRDFLRHRLAAVWNVARDHPGHLRGGRGRRVSLCVCLGLALFRGVVVCVLRRDLAAIAGARNANRMIAAVLP